MEVRSRIASSARRRLEKSVGVAEGVALRTSNPVVILVAGVALRLVLSISAAALSGPPFPRATAVSAVVSLGFVAAAAPISVVAQQPVVLSQIHLPKWRESLAV